MDHNSNGEVDDDVDNKKTKQMFIAWALCARFQVHLLNCAVNALWANNKLESDMLLYRRESNNKQSAVGAVFAILWIPGIATRFFFLSFGFALTCKAIQLLILPMTMQLQCFCYSYQYRNGWQQLIISNLFDLWTKDKLVEHVKKETFVPLLLLLACSVPSMFHRVWNCGR